MISFYDFSDMSHDLNDDVHDHGHYQRTFQVLIQGPLRSYGNFVVADLLPHHSVTDPVFLSQAIFLYIVGNNR